MTEAFDVVTCGVVAVVLGALGLWGRANAEALVTKALPSEEREHRENVLRRGAVTCLAVAVLFTAAGVLLLLD
ncbi:hypothetical protein [Aeromicrobium terrae]|uniref:Uncharacterized protein n=1 Tax=Aeromicrobium terrae TaxID=2498846 RepID=A0A5C8NHY3_9ACTN|nr:hypothetical protein [Aeromicrobium terrae]TXL60696.1 hypothetical protein FHP06_09710 [Aeromicrobium terrae]